MMHVPLLSKTLLQFKMKGSIMLKHHDPVGFSSGTYISFWIKISIANINRYLKSQVKIIQILILKKKIYIKCNKDVASWLTHIIYNVYNF